MRGKILVAVSLLVAGMTAFAMNAGSVQANAVIPYTNWDPSAPPERLTDFAANLNKSMVTVYCRNGTGSGWAANIGIHPDAETSGYKTLIITNHHVVRDCTYAGTKYIEIRQGTTRFPAFVWNWDRDNDLASIYTTASLPKLKWSGVPRPLPGQWVAAFGSPFGLTGSITTGIVSYVGDTQLTSTAPINPGNSGGPLVDNMGRVVGINTATLDGSDGFGIVVGTPALCARMVNCRNPDQIWTDGPMKVALIFGERFGSQARFVVTGREIAGEIATLYIKRPGDSTFTAHSPSQKISNDGTATFVVNEKAQLSGYVEVGGIRTVTVNVPQAPETPAKLENVRAKALGGGRIAISWSTPRWSNSSDRAWFTYQVRGGERAWKSTRRTRVTVPGLATNSRVTVLVRASRGHPEYGGTLGPISRVTVRVK